MRRCHGPEIHTGRQAILQSVERLQAGAAAKSLKRILQIDGGAEQDNGIAVILEPLGGDVLGIVDHTHHRDGGGRINRAKRTALVVERDVAAGDRGPERAAALGSPASLSRPRGGPG